MGKTYWWRIMLLSVGLVLIGIAYVIENQLLFGFCNNVYYFGDYRGCLDKSSRTVGEPLFILSFSLIAISLFLFFINDKVFLKWLRFALGWIILSVILITLAPVSSGGWMSMFNPTKESVSIWMGSLFVILSLVKIVWDSKKSRKK